MNRQLRAAVIGAGSMGRNHARVYGDMDQVTLVAVADPDENALGRIAQRHNVQTYTDYRRMLAEEQIDLVSVVSPTVVHYPIVRDALHAGVPTLVEKPIASTVEEGIELTALSRSLGVQLTVGHIERFNPAIVALKAQLTRGALGRVYQIMARRIGPFPDRIRDVGVVVDLATHDLDIMHYLTDSTLLTVHAETSQHVHASHEDMLSALVRFKNDVIGVLDINWLTPTKVRELSVVGERGMFVANYLTQELFFYENDAAPQEDSDYHLAVLGVAEGRMIRLKVGKKEPLRAELESFVRSVQTGVRPTVSAMDGLRALAMAEKLVESGRYGHTLHVDDIYDQLSPLESVLYTPSRILDKSA